MRLSTNNFISLWIFLELNLLSFIIWGFSSKDKPLILKYFLIQRFFSILILSFYFFQLIFIKQAIFLLLFSSIILSKLGTPPIYLWFINISSKANYKTLFLLCTIQKIIPIFILYSALPHLYFTWTVLTILLTIKRLHRLIHLKKILAFSSIFNLTWIFLSFNNFNLIIIFFIIYIVNLLNLIVLLLKTQKSELISDFYSLNLPRTQIYITFLNLLNIMGIPPFLGFLRKILIIENFIFYKPNILILNLILLANIFLIFIYTRIFFLMNTLSISFLTIKPYIFKTLHILIFSIYASLLLLTL